MCAGTLGHWFENEVKFSNRANPVKIKIVVLLVLALGTAQVVFADAFSTNGTCVGGTANAGVTGNNGSTVSAGATISYSGGLVTVTLTNCLVNPTSISQNISDIFFSIAGATGSTSGQIGSLNTTALVTVAADGTTTSSSGSVLWNLIVSGDTFHLTDLIGNSPTTPTSTIIGAPGGGGVYSNANGSIAGNVPHNPFINQTATWTFACASCGGAIGDVVISFGTTPTSVPEPASMLLLGSGLSALGIFSRRKLRK